ncbi:hypothetical protein [Extibacter muris]|uniref:hypothetical protein n=1 Tax=Extibacter muris TaxID=1796622 RepID=UPI001D06117A|nr:hypothetical protein [Extibacter muris]MCB6200477.1 hypothetical protein [Extibacter muris]MCQ4663412.1 hypothetical protein [Extibacter muris]MCQ4692836.1 hypothetical protein [Extibacter muris]
MKDNIIDFCSARKKHQDNRMAELDQLSEEVEAMDMDAAIRYLIGAEGGSREAAKQCCDTMNRVHKANLKIQP